MEKLRQKQPRLALMPEEYGALRMAVLQRDGWKCQCCGSAANLHVHHMRHRGRLGSDVIDNLITLCVDCHGKLHRNSRLSEPRGS
jgi:5-methylcytosine-specific restriction endonuclease McrA